MTMGELSARAGRASAAVPAAREAPSVNRRRVIDMCFPPDVEPGSSDHTIGCAAIRARCAQGDRLNRRRQGGAAPLTPGKGGAFAIQSLFCFERGPTQL